MQQMVLEHGNHKSVERRRGAKAVTAICSNSAWMAALILQITAKMEMTLSGVFANVPMRAVMDAAASMIGELIQQRIQTQSAKRTWRTCARRVVLLWTAVASVFAWGCARMAVNVQTPKLFLGCTNSGTPTTVKIANVQALSTAQQSCASKAGRTTRQRKTDATAVQTKKAIPHLARAREATAEAVVSTRTGRRARATAPGVHAEDTKNVLRKVPSRKRPTVIACAVQAGPNGIRLAATLRVQQMARQPNAPRPLDTSEIAGFIW